ENLLPRLAAAAGADEVHLFLDRRARGASGNLGVPADRCHYVWADNNQLANLTVLPRIADRLGLDVVVYQNFAPPLFLARHARVAFIYDVIFRDQPSYFTRRERLYFAPMRWLASRADRVCTLTESERQRLV